MSMMIRVDGVPGMFSLARSISLLWIDFHSRKASGCIDSQSSVQQQINHLINIGTVWAIYVRECGIKLFGDSMHEDGRSVRCVLMDLRESMISKCGELEHVQAESGIHTKKNPSHFNNKVNKKRHKVGSALTLASSSNAISWLNRFQWKLIWISCKFCSVFFLLPILATSGVESRAASFWAIFEFPLLCSEARHVWWKICIWLILLLKIESECCRNEWCFLLLKLNIGILYIFQFIYERATADFARREHFGMEIFGFTWRCCCTLIACSADTTADISGAVKNKKLKWNFRSRYIWRERKYIFSRLWKL